MLTIPTSELTGLLSDVLAFAPVVKDDPNRGVLIEWDGETLYASAYDVLSGARSSWTPGEGQEGEEAENDEEHPADQLGWGGDAAAWRAFVTFDDAKEIVKVFKLPAKRWWVPVTVKISPTWSRLTIERTGDFGPTEALLSARVDPDRTTKFPSVADIFRDAVSGSLARDTGQIFSPYRMAAFGTVRAHGPLALQHAVDGPTAAAMGTRLIGFIWPNGARKADALAQAAAAAGRIDA